MTGRSAQAATECAANAVVQRACACQNGAADNADDLQTKLQLGAVGDRYEREADQIADQMVADAAGARAQPITVSPLVQRRADPGQTRNNQARATGQSEAAPALARAARAVSGGGQALPRSERRFFEGRLQRDLSGVRIHDHARAAGAATAIDARAYTLRNQIAFAPGQYRPETADGRRLLAHELVHVGQQSGGSAMAAPGVIQRDCAADKAKCRNAMNYSDGGHWQGPKPEPDCNCDSTFSDAKASCGNRSNWSDGGHWIGSTPKPDCSLSKTVQSTATLTYTFPTNECVQGFNQQRNSITTHLSTGIGIIVAAVASAASKNPLWGIGAGAAANEAIGAIPDTQIGVGYRWVRKFTMVYTRSAHPWGANELRYGIESAVYNENDELTTGYSFSKAFTGPELRILGPVLTGDPVNSTRTIPCPSANVLSK